MRSICLALIAGALLASSPVAVKAKSAPGIDAFVPFGFPVISTEGIAADKVGSIYVSAMVFTGGGLTDQILKVSPSGEVSVFADLQTPDSGRGGLAVDAKGTLYIARNGVPGRGVFRVEDGTVTLVPGTDSMDFPNALAFDQRGNLYITETFTGVPPAGPYGMGGIWRVPKGGAAEPWLHHPLLSGATNVLYPFPVGANGIAFFKGSLYVIVTDTNAIIRIPIRPDGSPGEPETWAQIQDPPESILYGVSAFPLMLDGLAIDVHGNIFVTAISRLAVIRVDAVTRQQSTVAAFPSFPLETPVNAAFGTGKGERQTLFVTNMGITNQVIPGPEWPGPGLVKIDVGVPGAPLP